MKRNFKKTVSLILAVLMVMTIVPLSGMATEGECDHANATITPIDGVEHLVKCECGYRGYEYCDGPAATTCGEAPKCTKCQAVIGEALDHDFSKEDSADRYIATEGDCLTKKTYYKSCVVCGALPENLEDAACFVGEEYGDHVFTTYEAKGDATCTDPGHKVAVCDVCEEETDEIDGDDECLAPHNFQNIIDDEYEVTAPDCDTAGVYYQKCADCGAKGSETFETESLGHNFEEVTDLTLTIKKTAETCSKKATYYKVCSNDGCGVVAVHVLGADTDETFEAGEPHARPTKFEDVCEILYKKDARGDLVLDANNKPIVLRDREVIFAATCMEPEKCSYLCELCGEPLVPADEYVAGGKYSAEYELYINYDHPALNPNHQLEETIIDGKKVKLMELVETEAYWDATCTKEGRAKTYRCLFHEGPDKIVGGEKIPVAPHTYDETKTKTYVDASCRTAGHYASKSCTGCNTAFYFDKDGKEVGTGNFGIDKTMPKLDHKDTNGDGICDLKYLNDKGDSAICGLEINKEENNGCSCICHQGGIMYFVAMILKWFWRFTGRNQYCACGAAHY